MSRWLVGSESRERRPSVDVRIPAPASSGRERPPPAAPGVAAASAAAAVKLQLAEAADDDDAAEEFAAAGAVAPAELPNEGAYTAWLFGAEACREAEPSALERDILERALERHRYNRTAAGASLGLSLRQMRYRMARLGVGVTEGDRIEPH